MEEAKQTMTLREIDAAVAEKVMGWRRGSARRGDHAWISDLGRQTPVLPNYSTDIADAWQVVERMVDRWQHGMWMTTDGQDRSKRYCYFVLDGGHDDNRHAAEGSSAPLAICQAALKALASALPPDAKGTK